MINSVRYESGNSSEQMQFNVLTDSGGGCSFIAGESPRTPSRASTQSITPNISPEEPVGPGNVSNLKIRKIIEKNI